MVALSKEKVVVVGGGLLGVSTAYELASEGVPVTLLEAKDELADEASYGNGGLLTPGISDPWNGPGVFGHLLASLFNPRSPMELRIKAIPGLFTWGLEFLKHSKAEHHREVTIANYLLCEYSLACTRAIRDEHGLQYDSRDRGCLKVFASEQEMAGPLAIAHYLEPHGLRVTRLDTQGVLDIEPTLVHAADKIACGLYYPAEASGDSCLFTRELARVAVARGASIMTGRRVDRVLRRGDAIVGVESRGEEFDGDVVLAAGYGSPDLVRGLGIHLPVKPAKGYSLTVDASPLGSDGPTLPVVDDHMHAAVSPLGNRLRFVGTAEFAGRDYNIRQVRIDNLFALFERLFPTLVDRIDLASAEPWCGLRPMSADGTAFVGHSGREGLWLNTGHGHMGWSMASGSGRALADLMLGRKPALDVTPFDPCRRKKR